MNEIVTIKINEIMYLIVTVLNFTLAKYEKLIYWNSQPVIEIRRSLVIEKFRKSTPLGLKKLTRRI